MIPTAPPNDVLQRRRELFRSLGDDFESSFEGYGEEIEDNSDDLELGYYSEQEHPRGYAGKWRLKPDTGGGESGGSESGGPQDKIYRGYTITKVETYGGPRKYIWHITAPGETIADESADTLKDAKALIDIFAAKQRQVAADSTGSRIAVGDDVVWSSVSQHGTSEGTIIKFIDNEDGTISALIKSTTGEQVTVPTKHLSFSPLWVFKGEIRKTGSDVHWAKFVNRKTKKTRYATTSRSGKTRFVKHYRLSNPGDYYRETEHPRGYAGKWRLKPTEKIQPFPGSAVQDVVFHGTPEAITQFDPTVGKNLGGFGSEGIFFTASPEVAAGYSASQSLKVKQALASEEVAIDTLDIWLQGIADKTDTMKQETLQGRSRWINDLLDQNKITREEYDKFFELEDAAEALNQPGMGDWENETDIRTPNIIAAYINIQRPLEIDANGMNWDIIVPRTMQKIDRDKYDGVIIKNVKDNANEYEIKTTTYVVFDHKQIKSAISGVQLSNPGDYYREPEHPRGYAGRWREKPDEPATTATRDDAAQEYKERGTQASSFKKWFGDWENDPQGASKVVNPETGEPEKEHPLQVYHGTSKGEFVAFDKSKQDPGALYGPGFYFTENLRIAMAYQKKDIEESYLVSATKFQEVEKYLETQLPTGQYSGWKMQPGVNYRSNFYPVSTKPEDIDRMGLVVGWLYDKDKVSLELRAVRKLLHQIVDPSLTPEQSKAWIEQNVDHIVAMAGGKKADQALQVCYLNIRNPFRIDSTYSKAQVQKSFGGEFVHWLEMSSIKSDMRGPNNDEWKGDFLYDHIVQRMAERKDIKEGHKSGKHIKQIGQDILREAGFDGITHIGGGNTAQGEPHRVWIAFEPNQIKAVDNIGTFDPAKDEIKLANTYYQETEHPRGYAGRWREKVSESEDFKQWFDGSKVVKGMSVEVAPYKWETRFLPARVYHGTASAFEKFENRPDIAGHESAALGFWFSDYAEYASRVSMLKKPESENKQVIPVYLKIVNPKIYDFYHQVTDDMQAVGGAEKLKAKLIAEGYDGIKIQTSTTDFPDIASIHWVAFDHSQIRSAISGLELAATDYYQELQHPRGYAGRWRLKPGEPPAEKVKPFPGSAVQNIVFHGTTKAFEKFNFDPARSKYATLDQMLGTHFANDKRTGEAFTFDKGKGYIDPRLENSEGGRLIPAYINIQKPRIVNQDVKYSDGTTSRVATDGVAIADDILDVVFSDPKNKPLFVEMITKRAAATVEQANQIYDAVIKGENVTGIPGFDFDFHGKYRSTQSARTPIGQYIDNWDSGLQHLSIEQRSDVLKQYKEKLAAMGFDGIKYINTAPMETEHAPGGPVEDKTAWIVFDNSQIKSAISGLQLATDYYKETEHPRGYAGKWRLKPGEEKAEKVKPFPGSTVQQMVFHATTSKDFAKFKRRLGDVGIHFGTLGQAEDRTAYQSRHKKDKTALVEGERVIPAYINIRKPLRTTDLGAWDWENLSFGLEKAGISLDDIRNATKDKRAASAKLAALRDMLKRKGYDGIVYKNEGEVAGGAAYAKAQDEANDVLVARQKRLGKSTYGYDMEDQESPEYLAHHKAYKAYEEFRTKNAEDSYIVFDHEQIRSAISGLQLASAGQKPESY